MNVNILKAEWHHKEVIRDFQIKMAWETEALFLNPEEVAAGVKYIFDNPHRGEYWLAEVNGKIAASLLIQFEWSDWRNGEVLWLHSVYVLPEWRKTGIFGQMFKKLKSLVENELKYRGIRLYVDKTNLKAQHVYQRLGMNAQHYDMYEWFKPNI